MDGTEFFFYHALYDFHPPCSRVQAAYQTMFFLQKREPFAQLDVDLRVTDYSQTSILSILDETNATSLFSFIHSDDPAFYNTVHESLLAACRSSKVCKRFAPSEYGGNITRFPDLPRFYGPTHGEFRKVLQAQNDVQWSLVNGGWFMDYFVEPEKTFMKPLPGVWPLDLTRRKALMLGTGDEEIGWTAARDVAKALVRLAGMPKWVRVTGQNRSVSMLWKLLTCRRNNLHILQVKSGPGNRLSKS